MGLRRSVRVGLGRDRPEGLVDLGAAFVENPKETTYYLFLEPIYTDWQAGNYGEAIGGSLFVAVEIVVGAKGAASGARAATAAIRGSNAAQTVRAAAAGTSQTIRAGAARVRAGLAEMRANLPAARPSIADLPAVRPGSRSHMFRNAPGHIADTPANELLIRQTAGNPANLAGTRPGGIDVFTTELADGSQVWVEVFKGEITNGGINNAPRVWDPLTGRLIPGGGG